MILHQIDFNIIYIPKSMLPRHAQIRLRIAKYREWQKNYKWQKLKDMNENTK
jgi:hypothetical protein